MGVGQAEMSHLTLAPPASCRLPAGISVSLLQIYSSFEGYPGISGRLFFLAGGLNNQGDLYMMNYTIDSLTNKLLVRPQWIQTGSERGKCVSTVPMLCR